MSGRTLGRYRLTTAAEPRAGAVVAAEDTLLDRRVDLLLLPAAAAAQPERLARIRQEVERAAAFVHPDVITVYGLEEGDGRLFVTLEPAVGRTLRDLLATGRLPVASALAVGLVLVDVLVAAQQAGVVHGGLHPGDVVLRDDGTIAVGGFGQRELRLAVAEDLGEPPAAEPYRPPEAAAERLPDHRADLFALGRLVEEMLAAAAAAPGEGPPEAATAGLREALERCLEEDPTRRPRSAAELRPPLERLRRDLLREPEPAAEPEKAARGRALGAPLRWGLLALAALLVGLAGWALWRGPARPPGGAAPATTGPPEASGVEPVDLAVMPFTAPGEEADARLAAAFGREVNRLLERDRSISVIAAGSAAAAAGEPSAAAAAGRLGAAHLLQGSFEWQRDDELSRAEVTVRLSRAADGEVLWQETLEGFFGEIGALQDRVASAAARRLGATGRAAARTATESPGAYEAYLEGVGRAATAATTEELGAAAASFERAAMLDPGLLLAHTGQVDVGLALAALAPPAPEALTAARQALAAARRIDPGDPAVRRAAAGLELASAGDPAVALSEYEAALERLPGQPDLLHAASLLDRRQGRWDEAAERLLAARRRDPLDLELGADLVRTLAWQRRFAEAAGQAEELAALLPQAALPTLLRADLELRERGATGRSRALLEGMGEAARADAGWQERMLRLDLYEGEYAAALDRLPRLRLGDAEELIERAWIHRHMGRAGRAAADFERARDLLDDRLGAAPDDPWLSSLLGQAYAGTGGPHLAARMGQRAVGQLPVTSNAVGGALLVERLARTYVLAGDFERALDELAFLLEIPSPLTVAVVRLDPAWDALAADPRFAALLERFAA